MMPVSLLSPQCGRVPLHPGEGDGAAPRQAGDRQERGRVPPDRGGRAQGCRPGGGHQAEAEGEESRWSCALRSDLRVTPQL